MTELVLHSLYVTGLIEEPIKLHFFYSGGHLRTAMAGGCLQTVALAKTAGQSTNGNKSEYKIAKGCQREIEL